MVDYHLDIIYLLFVAAVGGGVTSFSPSVIESGQPMAGLERIQVTDISNPIKLRCHELKGKTIYATDDFMWEFKRCGYGLNLTACEDVGASIPWELAYCRNGSKLCTGSTLPIYKPSESDSGLYRCLHKNYMEQRYRVHTTIQLDVRDPKSKSIEILPEAAEVDNPTVFENETAVLRCRVRSLAYPHIVWARYASKATSPPAVTIAGIVYQFLNASQMHDGPDRTYTSKLVLSNVEPKDAGQYICFALDARQNFSKVVSLNVIPLMFNFKDPSFVNETTWWVTVLLVLSAVICLLVVCLVLRRQTSKALAAPDGDDEEERSTFHSSLC